jgi:hypothetical protein
MSIEFGIWFSVRNISPEQAAKIYTQLCEGDTSVVEGNDAIGEFVKELTSRYPQVQDCPEDKPLLCPWTCPFDISPRHVVISMSASLRWAGEAYSLIRKLAAKHGLILYKPQSKAVHVPSWSRRIGKRLSQKLKPGRYYIRLGILLLLAGALFFVVMRFLWSLLGLNRFR